MHFSPPSLRSDYFHFHDEEMVYQSCGSSFTPWGIVPHYLRSCLHSTDSSLQMEEKKEIDEERNAAKKDSSEGVEYKKCSVQSVYVCVAAKDTLKHLCAPVPKAFLNRSLTWNSTLNKFGMKTILLAFGFTWDTAPRVLHQSDVCV